MKTIICIILLGIGIYLGKKLMNKFEISGLILIATCASVLAVMLTMLPIARYKYHYKIEEYKAFTQTIESVRLEEMKDVERAAIANKIALWNEFIAATKYKKSTVLDLYIPKEATQLELIK